MNHKEEMLNLIDRLARAQDVRTEFVAGSRNVTDRMLHAFQKRQNEMRHELKSSAQELRKTMTMDEKRRMDESRQFKTMLDHEQKARCANARDRMSSVNRMMNEFNGDRMCLKNEIHRNAEELFNDLSNAEQERLAEAGRFQEELDAEAKERMDLTADRCLEIGRMLGTMAGLQADIKAELAESFADARTMRKGWADDRQEIKDAWMKMTMGRSSKHSFPQVHRPAPENAHSGDTQSCCQTQKEERQESEEAPAPDLLLTVKATLATFPEGCRFNELYRNVEGMSKAQLRNCLSYLLKTHELRRDAEDHYHLT
jgi:hypothetical protein